MTSLAFAEGELDFVLDRLSGAGQADLNAWRSDLQDRWSGYDSQPPGGYLIRFPLDVTGDGIPETFVAWTLAIDRTSPSWVAYSKSQQATPMRIADALHFEPSEGFLNSGQSSPELWIGIARTRPEIVFNLTKFVYRDGRLDVDRVVDLRDTSSPDNFPDDSLASWRQNALRRGLRIGERLQVKQEKITLGEFIQNPRKAWRPFSTEHAYDAQQLDPAETQIVAALKEFTLDDALSLVERLKSSLEPPNPKPATNEHPQSPRSPLGAENQSAPLKATHNDTSNATPFAVWGMLFLAGAVGVLFWWARRKGT